MNVEKISGDDLEIGFNNRYLLDALKGAELSGDDEVILRFSGSLTGMSVQPVDHDSYLYLVLPVRLN
jgi:DNA polymerase-3 subunit beta